jgi:predicted Fe-Mo cluster-binding NifX family protein
MPARTSHDGGLTSSDVVENPFFHSHTPGQERSVRIAVPSAGATPDGMPSDRFGRCAFFAIYDSGSRAWTFVPNPARNEAHGAGVFAAQCLVDHQVDVVIGPEAGPNARHVLEGAAVRCSTFPLVEGTRVADVVHALLGETPDREDAAGEMPGPAEVP